MKNDALRQAQESLRAAQLTTKKIEAREEIEDSPKKSGLSLLEAVRLVTLPVRRIGKVWDAAQDLYAKVSPYIGPILKPVGWAWRGAKAAFNYAAFEREDGKQKLDADGDPIFSARRLCKAFTLAVGLGLATLGGVQTAYYYGTQFSEIVYVTGKQEIEQGEKYQFTGCTSLPCSTDSGNGKYYQIEKSYYSPRLVYPEEDIYANIPNEMSVCKVEGYGWYSKELRILHKALSWYQNVTNVSCRPMTQDEIRQAMHPEEQSATQPAEQSPEKTAEEGFKYVADRPVELQVRFPTGP